MNDGRVINNLIDKILVASKMGGTERNENTSVELSHYGQCCGKEIASRNLEASLARCSFSA